MSKYIYTFLTFICLMSCKPYFNKPIVDDYTNKNIQLGVIGEKQHFLFKRDYNQITLPKFNKIRVDVSLLFFNRNMFKHFEKAKVFQNKDVKVKYNDSLKSKSPFLKIEIADRISVMKSLNKDRDILQFLKHNNKTHLVSEILIALNNDDVNHLNTAEEVFLEQVGFNSFALKTYKMKKQQEVIYFKSGVIFGYKTSGFCWDKDKEKIIDIHEMSDRCSKVKSNKRKINYYKF